MKKHILQATAIMAVLITGQFIFAESHNAHEAKTEQMIDFSMIDQAHEDNFTRKALNNIGVETGNWDNNLNDHVTIKTADDGNKYMQVFTPKDGYGTKTSGAQVELKLHPSDAYYSSYDLMFDENFSWGSEYRGGKLPGLTAGKRCSQGCDGTDGFATRYMWRREGEGELYLCNVDKQSKDCDDYYFTNPDGTRFKFEKGKKYTIEQYVTINSSADSYDGQVRVIINGTEVLNLTGIRLTTNEQQIDTFYLSTFYGGNSTKWKASNDSYLYIDNIYTKAL